VADLDLSVDALLKLEYAVPPHQRAHAEWVMSRAVYDHIVDLCRLPLPDPGDRDLSYPAHLLGYPVRVEDGAEDIALKPVGQAHAWAEGYIECADRDCVEHRYGPHAHRIG
jgi:HK97 family phage major capsid protein